MHYKAFVNTSCNQAAVLLKLSCRQHFSMQAAFQHCNCFWQSAPMLVTEGVAKAPAEQQNSGSRSAALCASAMCPYLFMAALSLATAASTSVMMLPGPIAFTLTLCGARARAIHLHGQLQRCMPSLSMSKAQACTSKPPSETLLSICMSHWKTS